MSEANYCFLLSAYCLLVKGGSLAETRSRGEGVGQIVRLYAEVATVLLDGREVECAIRGKLYRSDTPSTRSTSSAVRAVGSTRSEVQQTYPPAVGDFVKVERAGGRDVITEVLPRKSALVRRAAGTTVKKQVMIANIDQVVVVFAAAKPEPNPAAIDRFLVVAEANDLQARIVINKLDLAQDAEVE